MYGQAPVYGQNPYEQNGYQQQMYDPNSPTYYDQGTMYPQQNTMMQPMQPPMYQQPPIYQQPPMYQQQPSYPQQKIVIPISNPKPLSSGSSDCPFCKVETDTLHRSSTNTMGYIAAGLMLCCCMCWLPFFMPGFQDKYLICAKCGGVKKSTYAASSVY